MLTRPKYPRILQLAVYLFIATTAIFLLVPLSGILAANLDVGLEYAAGTGLSNALDIRIIIARIIRIALGFLGIIAVGLVMYAGFLWMTSGGNEEKIEQAKKILQNAVIGLIIILISFAIVSFILNLLIGATTGGQNGPGSGPPSRYGLSALGNGIIQSHYPARDQKEVPRNTSIIISFREPMKADTLCVNPISQGTGNPDKCEGDKNTTKGDINTSVIGIFKKSDEDKCIDNNLPLASCPSFVSAEVYSTPDGKTFVFVPNNYLGSPSEYINYTVYLGKGLLRQTGDLAFPSGFAKDYGWSFEVSNKIDWTPPQVNPNGVFPPPDNLKDITVPGVGAQARGTIMVNSPRFYSGASVSGITPAASVSISENCQQDGDFSINIASIANGLVATLYQGTFDPNNPINFIKLGQGVINGQTVTFSSCNLRLTIGSGNFGAGNLWTFTINPMITADTITVGNITYTASDASGINNFVVGSTNLTTAQNIRNVLGANPEVDIVVGTDDVVTIKAKLAGAAGNSINLSSSNATRLPVVAMDGGADKVDRVTVNGKKDQPMNSALQINFNEAIMPLTVSGTSAEVKDFIRVVNEGGTKIAGVVCTENYECLSYRCEGSSGNKACVTSDALKSDGDSCQSDGQCLSYKCESSKCVGDSLAGKFAVSNQYQTVEFLSDKECGFNSCGEKIYCLPANSHLRVELKAAKLVDCGTDNCASKSPFNTCDSGKPACKDANDKYYPQADPAKLTTVDGGITDAAFNSLDGNRDGSAYGPASFYNENIPPTVPPATDGDNFKWSFFISDVLDLIPPKIKDTIPILKDPLPVNLTDRITISFDKVMLSSRLTTGSLMIKNGQQNIQHYLLNLRNLADQPVGYWATNLGQLNGTGEIISTDAYINHSSFNASSTYKAQAGSGLKDIYQNCFLPCASESGVCAGVDSQEPCCCNGTPAASCP